MRNARFHGGAGQLRVAHTNEHRRTVTKRLEASALLTRDGSRRKTFAISTGCPCFTDASPTIALIVRMPCSGQRLWNTPAAVRPVAYAR